MDWRDKPGIQPPPSRKKPGRKVRTVIDSTGRNPSSWPLWRTLPGEMKSDRSSIQKLETNGPSWSGRLQVASTFQGIPLNDLEDFTLHTNTTAAPLCLMLWKDRGDEGKAAPDYQYRIQYVEEEKIESSLSNFGRTAKNAVSSFWLTCWRQNTTVEFPFSLAAREALINSLEIPTEWLDVECHRAGICGKYTTPSGCKGYVYRRSNNWGTISLFLNYDESTNQTRGYLLAGPNLEAQSVVESILSSFGALGHPLLLPILMGEITANDLMERLIDVHLCLAEMESMTGFGDWESEPKSKRKEKGRAVLEARPGVSRANIDREKLASELGIQSSRLAYIQAAIECTVQTNDFTLSELTAWKNRQSLGPTKGYSQSMMQDLKDRSTLLANGLLHLRQFGGLNQRLQALQNFLYNPMNQQDSQINIQLARDSKVLAASTKRDSGAMVVIAVLTTFFLPGTFVATIFAMPLFKWDASCMGGVMAGRFWVYLAVTLPITVLVMGLVIAFAVYQMRMRDNDIKEAEKAATRLVSEDV